MNFSRQISPYTSSNEPKRVCQLKKKIHVVGIFFTFDAFAESISFDISIAVVTFFLHVRSNCSYFCLVTRRFDHSTYILFSFNFTDKFFRRIKVYLYNHPLLWTFEMNVSFFFDSFSSIRENEPGRVKFKVFSDSFVCLIFQLVLCNRSFFAPKDVCVELFFCLPKKKNSLREIKSFLMFRSNE